MRFDLADLRLFLNVVEAGSITRGAERTHLAIAAASTRVRNMEAALGTPLLHRERQGTTPTEAGRTLVHHARILLQQADRMHGDLGQYAEGIRGQVRLLSNTNALTEFLPEPLSAFLAAHPQINIDLEERLSYEIVAAIADGAADIGIVAGRSKPPASRFCRFAPTGLYSWSRRIIRSHPPSAALSLRCSIAISWAWTGPAHCSASCWKRPKGTAAGSNCESNCAASTRSAGWSNAMSGSAWFRRRVPSATPKPWRSIGSS